MSRNLHLTHLFLLRLTLVVAGICLFLLTPMLARASDGSALSGGLLDSIAPLFSVGIDLVITAIVTWAAVRLRAATGIEIEARHRDALQSALRTGAGRVVSRIAGSNPAALPLAGESAEAINTVIDWVERSTPDALNYFRARGALAPQALTDLAVGALGQQISRVALPVSVQLAPADLGGGAGGGTQFHGSGDASSGLRQARAQILGLSEDRQ